MVVENKARLVRRVLRSDIAPDCRATFPLFLYLHPIRYSALIRWYRSIMCSS